MVHYEGKAGELVVSRATRRGTAEVEIKLRGFGRAEFGGSVLFRNSRMALMGESGLMRASVRCGSRRASREERRRRQGCVGVVRELGEAWGARTPAHNTRGEYGVGKNPSRSISTAKGPGFRRFRARR